MHIAKIERLVRRLSVLALAVCLIGCIDENPQSRDDDPFNSGPMGGTPSQCQSLEGPADPCPADNISNRHASLVRHHVARTETKQLR